MTKYEAMKLTDEEIETKWFIDLDEACEALRRVEHHIANGGKVIEQPAQQEPVATVTVMTQGVRRNYSFIALKRLPDGVNELYTSPQPAQQCKWPACQREDYQQALAEQIKRELVGEQPAQPQLPQGWSVVQVTGDHTKVWPMTEDQIQAAAFSRLYTSSPAQRKPLTVDELWRVFTRSGLSQFHHRDGVVEYKYEKCIEEFARAIKAAHGIKENT